MAQEPDVLEKPRRNLLIVTSILLVIQVTGASVSAINLPSVSLNFVRPQLLIYCVWAVWLHSLWFFWIQGRHTQNFRDRAVEFSHRGRYVMKAIKATGMNMHHFDNPDHSPQISRQFFRRSVSFYDASIVDKISRTRIVRLSYWRQFIPELKGDLHCMLIDRNFCSYEFAVIYAYVPLALKVFELIYDYSSKNSLF